MQVPNASVVERTGFVKERSGFAAMMCFIRCIKSLTHKRQLAFINYGINVKKSQTPFFFNFFLSIGFISLGHQSIF